MEEHNEIAIMILRTKHSNYAFGRFIRPSCWFGNTSLRQMTTKNLWTAIRTNIHLDIQKTKIWRPKKFIANDTNNGT